MTNNIYYDCEFLEGTQKRRIFGIPLGLKTNPKIDLISIGMVDENLNQYYAISNEFNIREAWNRYELKANGCNRTYSKVYWIRENVLKPIWRELFLLQESEIFFLSGPEYAELKSEIDGGLCDEEFTLKSFTNLIKKHGISRKEIAEEVMLFVSECNYRKELKARHEVRNVLFGYYSAYDHVALCWLFGKMIDLPDTFPKYTYDLKQLFDDKTNLLLGNDYGNFNTKDIKNKERTALFPSFGDFQNRLKILPNYPSSSNEHNALSDAVFNKRLHDFLIQL